MAMKQLDLFSSLPSQPAPPPPRAGRSDPLLWVSELLILRDWALSDEAVIRRIKLRRGLNVLWAPPAPESVENRLGDGQITGHTAGKTTFCRFIRYLLGEQRFGTARAQERIRDALPEGWVVAEVFVGDERWIVGRPFALGVHPFAVKGSSVEEALAERGRGGYQEFLGAVGRTVVEPTKVKELPHQRQPIGWEHVLAWAVRDQEARFAGLVEWRDPSSESETQRLTIDDKHVVVRAMLGLMSDEEGEAQRKFEDLTKEKASLEEQAPLLVERASEDRRRLMKRLGLRAGGKDDGPLFATRLHDHVKERRAALEAAEGAIEGLRAEIGAARERAREAAEACGVRRQEVREAEKRIAEERQRIERSGMHTEEGRAEPSPGQCGVPLRLALAQGCPLAEAQAAAEAARRGEGAAEAAPGLEEALAEAERALEEARAEERALAEEHARLSSKLNEESARIAEGRAEIAELEGLFGYVKDAERDAAQNARRLEKLADSVKESSELQAALRREHNEAIARLSDRFGEVVRALLGEHVEARVEVRGRRVETRVDDRGEREGAAMTTIKLLAFDLAALKLGVDGHGQFPGLLVHDGPREADMDGRIYERIFLYAKLLEEKSKGAPAFQYVITTTAPPPVELQTSPWLLDPLLDASKPEGRLLKMDL
ncbi:hypothetical protein [Polyangium aurulentum]|uniref:hypothetical protein n=1 Tax=Polyangium aurulentum TaxID=2567896 RepID=UPI00146B1A0E|nr:hypothetical protein [Polyangium aurulentum]UQA57253.1 hypothetical protein E8A73_039130 [Polyangium aurulentum]